MKRLLLVVILTALLVPNVAHAQLSDECRDWLGGVFVVAISVETEVATEPDPMQGYIDNFATMSDQMQLLIDNPPPAACEYGELYLASLNFIKLRMDFWTYGILTEVPGMDAGAGIKIGQLEGDMEDAMERVVSAIDEVLE